MGNNPSNAPLSTSGVWKSHFSSARCLVLVAPKNGDSYRRALPEMD
jgi:hypothetical protein